MIFTTHHEAPDESYSHCRVGQRLSASPCQLLLNVCPIYQLYTYRLVDMTVICEVKDLVIDFTWLLTNQYEHASIAAQLAYS